MEGTKAISRQIVKCFENGHKLLICGNGGSAAQAQHMAAEFVGKFEHDRDPLPAIALTTDTSFLTAWSNDRDYDTVFARQVQALGQSDDLLIVFSTSGKSKSCLAAIRTAQGIGLGIIDWPRKGKDTAEVQEYQLKTMHRVVREVERDFV